MNVEIIEKIETQIVDLPLKRVHKFSATSITTKAFLIVRIYSNNGVIGIGEATTPGGPWWAGEAIETIQVMIEQYFKPILIGQNALNITQILAKLDKVAFGNTFAKAAVEMALFDLKGRSMNVPVYQLLGGLFRESSRVNWPLAMGDSKLDLAEAERLMSDNLAHDFKVKMGYKSPQEDVKYLGELCSVLVDKASVRGDLNGAWDESTARQFLPALEAHGMKFIEQPMPSWNRAGMARVREFIGMPILADESIRTIQDTLDLVNLAAADAISFKPMKSGGLLVCQQISAIAAASGVSCYAGTFLESSIGTASMMHLVAATPNLDYGNELVGPMWLADDIVQQPMQYRDNQIWVTHTPGLGIDLDEDKVKHYLRR